MKKNNEVKTSFSAVLDIINSICIEEYGEVYREIEKIYRDVEDLYNGKWTEYQACDTGYHNFNHASEVTLASVRMMAGWNRAEKEKKIPFDCFKIGVVSAIFHDSGYIKDIDDATGSGAKFTFTHVPRSMEMAVSYIKKNNWDQKAITAVPLIIGITEFNQPIYFDKYLEDDENLITVAKIVGTADLIAQAADVFYIERLPALFAEFDESYDFEGRENLKKRGIRIYSSVQEILSETLGFVENFVLPRFDYFGRMDKYLTVFFKTDRNPYLESISANLYRGLLQEQITRQKIGDILKELNIVDEAKLKDAMFIQKALRDDYDSLKDTSKRNLNFSLDNIHSIVKWMDKNSGYYNIGEILTKMGVVVPVDLRKAIIQQLLPANVFSFLKPPDFEFILSASILLLNLRRAPQVLTHVMDMMAQNIPCEASSILLADKHKHELVMAVVTGPKQKELDGLRLPWDKGVAGWVYNHGQWAVINKALCDNRFYNQIDNLSGFCTNSIMATPLVIDGQVVGIIELINKDNGSGIFNERDLAILHCLSLQIAGSIDTVLWMFQNKATLDKI